MDHLILRLFRTYLRLVWFLFGVVPGHLLILAHSRALASRGRPQSALLPVTFYRILGFVLTTLCFSAVNGIVTRCGTGT
jgi:hypothetical protein